MSVLADSLGQCIRLAVLPDPECITVSYSPLTLRAAALLPDTVPGGPVLSHHRRWRPLHFHLRHPLPANTSGFGLLPVHHLPDLLVTRKAQAKLVQVGGGFKLVSVNQCVLEQSES